MENLERNQLLEYRKKLQELSDKEKTLHDLHLRGLANGEIQGPLTGFPSLDKPWLKYYPKDAISAKIPTKTAYQFIYEKNKEKLNNIALKYFNINVTYKELFEKIEEIAKGLSNLGIKKGDIVTISLATTPELVYIIYALNRIGAISNAVDPRLKEKDFERSINDTKSEFIITLDMCLPELKNIIESGKIKKVVSLSPIESLPKFVKILAQLKNGLKKQYKNDNLINWKHLLKIGKNSSITINDYYEPNAPVTIVHTGGTTGKPKGVVLTNENFNAMALTQEISEYDVHEKDSFLTFLPPFIAYCLVNAIHDPLYLGFENTLVPTFEPEDFPVLMNKFKPNHVLAGPILWDYFIKSPLTKDMNLSFLKSPISGGDALNVELEKQINAFFQSHGCKHKLSQGYGMSEVAAAAVYSIDECYTLGSVGIPYVKNTIMALSDDKELPYNELGEICINAPTMMKEYINNQEETNNVVKEHDGKKYVHTGDIGYINENGNLFIEGRMKRMIVRSGNKIFPSNIEELILKVENVENCAVVGIPDEIERHVPVATLVLKDGINESEINNMILQIEQNISKVLPHFNVPVKFFIRNSLPLTTINKVDFKRLENDYSIYADNPNKVIFFTEGKKLERTRN